MSKKWNVFVLSNASRTHLAEQGSAKPICGITPTGNSETRYQADENYVRGLIKQSVPQSPPAYQFCKRCKKKFFQQIHAK